MHSARRRLAVAAALGLPWLAWVSTHNTFWHAGNMFAATATPTGNPWMAVQGVLGVLLPWGASRVFFPMSYLDPAEILFAIVGPLAAHVLYRVISKDPDERASRRLGAFMAGWCVLSVVFGPGALLGPLYQHGDFPLWTYLPGIAANLRLAVPSAVIWLGLAAPRLGVRLADALPGARSGHPPRG
ncbi:MAG: hypothetical protein ABFC80_07360 [Coriobacteriales bacterium]